MGKVDMGASQDKKVWYLRHLDLFLSLTDSEIEEIARGLNDRFFPADTELFHDRQREGIYLVKDGVVRLYSGSQQRQVTVALLGPGRLFGLSARFGDASSSIGATTLVSSYICSATWPEILRLFDSHPNVLLKMTQALVEQIYHAESWLERVNASSPRVRLADLLLELCDDFGEPVESGCRIRFCLTQTDIARMLNVSRETINRLLADFRRAGWVTYDQERLVIHDARPLETLVRRHGAT